MKVGVGMKVERSYTTEEIAQILKVSKLTVYDLIKKGKLRSYRVGRQIRVDAQDLENYRGQAKGKDIVQNSNMPSIVKSDDERSVLDQCIISGQDMSLDILANAIEKNKMRSRPLRSYVGSLNSLIAMYQGEADIVSTHLYDGETGTYNLPYIRRILTGRSYIVIHLLSRWAGFYVAEGNPLHIQNWQDLKNPDITMVNRETGSGVRVLVDEMLRKEGISPRSINGYDQIESNHIGVAGKVKSRQADVGVGIEKTARLVGVDFIPIIQEQYDLVLLKTPQNKGFVERLREILQSSAFTKELDAIGGYDLSRTGQIIEETF